MSFSSCCFSGWNACHQRTVSEDGTGRSHKRGEKPKYLAQRSNIAGSKLPRMEVSPMAKRAENDAWTYRLRHVCAMLGIAATVHVVDTLDPGGSQALVSWTPCHVQKSPVCSYPCSGNVPGAFPKRFRERSWNVPVFVVRLLRTSNNVPHVRCDRPSNNVPDLLNITAQDSSAYAEPGACILANLQGEALLLGRGLTKKLRRGQS